jgi:hypothetical protein
MVDLYLAAIVLCVGADCSIMSVNICFRFVSAGLWFLLLAVYM